MQRTLTASGIWGVLFLGLAAAEAAEIGGTPPASPAASMMELASVAVAPPVCEQMCRFDVAVDQVKLLSLIPTLQQRGLLSARIAADEIAQRPFFYTQAVALLMASYAVRERYERDPGLGTTAWRVTLAYPDGRKTESNEIFSFDFDRAAFAHTDWDQLVFVQFPRVAGQFSTNLWLTLRVSHEIGGSIDDD